MKIWSLEQRAMRVSLVTGASTVLAIVFQLLSVPICLYFWGSENYGTWLTIFAASMMLRTVDGGFITFVGNRFNLLYHQNTAELRRVLASAVIGVSILGLAQLAIAILIVYANWINELFGEASGAVVERGSSAFVVLVAAWVVSGAYLGIVHRLLIPAGMMYQAAWWSMGYQVAVFIGLIVAAVLQLDLLATSVLIASAQAIVYLMSAIYISVRLPEFYPWWKGMDWHTARLDLRDSTVFLVSGVLQQAGGNGLILLVTAALGPASVPAFTTVRTMVNLWNTVTTTLTAPLLPDMVRFHATRQIAKLQTLTEAHAWLSGTLVNVGVLIAYPVMGTVYRYWTGGSLGLDKGLLAALLSAIIISNASALVTMYLSGINESRAVLGVALLRAVLVLGVGVAAMNLGLAGFGLAVLVAELGCSAVLVLHYFPAALRELHGRVRWRPMLWPAASLGFSLLFLWVSSVDPEFPVTFYFLCLTGVITSSWLGWRCLDEDVRLRMMALGRRVMCIRMGE